MILLKRRYFLSLKIFVFLVLFFISFLYFFVLLLKKGWLMNSIKWWVVIFALLFLCLFQLNLAFSIGVYPSLKIFQYEKGDSFTSSFFIRNEDDRAYEVSVSLDGELKSFVDINQEKIVVEHGVQKEFKYALSLHSADLEPGSHEAIFYFRAVPTEEQSAQMNAVPTVVAKARVNVPYPGHYLDLILGDMSSEKEGVLQATVLYYNKGQEEVDELDCTLSTTDDSGASKSCTSSVEKISEGSEGFLSIECNGIFPVGYYPVLITCRYGEEEKVFEDSATIEGKQVEAEDFKLTEKEYSFNVRNLVNSNFSTVYAKVKLLDKNNKTLREFNTPAISLEENSDQRIEGVFPDSLSLKEGKYSAVIELFVDGKQTQFTLYTEAGKGLEDTPKTEPIREEKGFSVWIGVLVVLLILSFVIVLSLFNRKEKEMYF
jgi:hypothetical protein